MKKNSSRQSQLKKILAVPAAALMLGAASNGATVGIHYTINWGPHQPLGYYKSYAYLYSYMTTGMNVTGTAFGVPASQWTGIECYYYSQINNTTIVGPLTVVSTAYVAWSDGFGNTNSNIYGLAEIPPGDDQVVYAYLDDDVQKATSNPVYRLWNVQVSGLRAAYPNGYTIQTIGVPRNFPAPNANVTDGATFTNALVYTSLNDGGAAISSVSPVMTTDSINIYGDPPIGNKTNPGGPNIQHSTLAAFIITDAPGTVSPPLSLSIVGDNAVWSGGALQSTPVLGPNAVWTTLTHATSPYPILPSSAPAMYYRLIQTNAP